MGKVAVEGRNRGGATKSHRGERGECCETTASNERQRIDIDFEAAGKS